GLAILCAAVLAKWVAAVPLSIVALGWIGAGQTLRARAWRFANAGAIGMLVALACYVPFRRPVVLPPAQNFSGMMPSRDLLDEVKELVVRKYSVNSLAHVVAVHLEMLRDREWRDPDPGARISAALEPIRQTYDRTGKFDWSLWHERPSRVEAIVIWVCLA